MNKWDLTYFYKTEEEFEQAFESIKEYGRILPSFKGKLANEKDFVQYNIIQDEFNDELNKVYQFAALRSDLNKKDIKNAEALEKVFILYNQIASSMAWESPEIISLGEEKVMSFLKNNPEIEYKKFLYEKIFRSQEKILDAEKEGLLAQYSSVSGVAGDLYSALTVADGAPQKCELEDGKIVEVSQGNWRALIEENKSSEENRKRIFEALYSQYLKNKNTYGQIYATGLHMQKADMKNRKYNSILESHLFYNNIPTSVFTNIVEVASTQNASLKKYLKLRKEYLGIENYRTYDRFLQLATSSKKYTYEEAKGIFFASIKNCPQDFIDKAHVVLEEGFVDVYESEGKRSGAYSSSVTDSHPFILLNYDSTLDDVFTVAHEAGHSIHSLYAQEGQIGELQNYTIFVAEIASTFNEHMLLDYLIKSGNTTKEEKIMLLQKAIDEIYATFYRQLLFADFEYQASQKEENGEPINYQVLNDIMIDLYKKYYDLDITLEKGKEMVWAYIPHLFYTPFYVYQYATSFAASFALYKNVKDGKEGAFEKYLGLLKSGGSKYPVDQAREAGVDFENKDTFMAVINRLDELVDELEKLLK